MRTRTSLVIVVVVILNLVRATGTTSRTDHDELQAGQANAAASQAQQAKPVPPGDQAFRDATTIKDPDAKLRAFQKLLKDWPDSQAVKGGTVDFNILGLTTRAAGETAKEARRAAEAFAACTPNNRDDGAWQNMLIASDFVQSGTMWPEAERYARKALEFWDSGATREPPKRIGVALERAFVLTYLGQAIAKQGRDDEAEGYLRQAYQERANEPGIVGQVMPLLVDIAKRRGRTDQQMEYLIALALYGHLTPALRRELEQAYRQSHEGSLDGLEAMLDARYEAELPKAVPVEPFVRPAQPGARTVLAEMFTGASCAPCVGMDLAVEAAMRRYQPRDLAVLVYHVHSPTPDPLVNPSDEARAKAYRFYGAPHVAIDGLEFDDEGGGKAAEAPAIFRSRLQPAIDRAMQVPSGARLFVETTKVDDVIRAKVAVDQVRKGGPALRLQIALVEERVRYSGGNGIRFHPMVVRKMAGDGAGLPMPETGATKTNVTFDVAAIRAELEHYLDDFEKNGNADFKPSTFNEKKDDIDSNHLLVVAFVQAEASHRVLQATVSRIEPPAITKSGRVR